MRLWLAVFLSPVMRLDASQVYMPLFMDSKLEIIKHAFVSPGITVSLNFHSNLGYGTEAKVQFMVTAWPSVAYFSPFIATFSGPSDNRTKKGGLERSK